MDLKLMIGIGFALAGLIVVIAFTQGAAFIGIGGR
tara:strand:- start:282 stop:386 length:105 start_codon:yes stop_codon:yes gene_type:complete